MSTAYCIANAMWTCGHLCKMLKKGGDQGTEMATTSSTVEDRAVASEWTRWGQLIFGLICMLMIANLQYGWNLFVDPIDAQYHWGRPAIQVAFALFVLTETWLIPIE